MIIWLYGQPYSGKSTFANKFPKPFFISIDKNAKYITENYVDVNSLDEYSQELSKFMENPGDRETLIIDNIDLLEQFIRDYYLDKLGIEDESDLDNYGKTWRLIREGTYRSVMKSTKLNKKFKGDIILISQEDEYVTKSKLGAETTNYRPGINPKLHDRITSLTTLVCRTFKDSKKVNGEEVSRYYVSLGDKSNELSGTRIPLKETLIKNDYEEFKKAIGGNK